MADYSATVIEGLKNSASLKLLFYSSRIRLEIDTIIYRPQWRYSIASEKITIEFEVPIFIYYQGILNFSDCGVYPIGFAMAIL